MELNMLGPVDADEVSPVFRGANRKGVVLKGDAVAVDAEVSDILSVPWAHEGQMIDALRKEDADDVVLKSAVSALRLLNGIADDLPEDIREAVEKLGTEIYQSTNPALNTSRGVGNGGTLDATEGSDDDLDGHAKGPKKDGHGRDGELEGSGSAPKVAADMDDDGVMKDGKEPAGEYADSGMQADKKKRYPLDTEEHVRAAWSYINMPKNASKYSAGDLQTVKARIKAAMKRVGADVSKEEDEAANLLDRALEAVHKAFRPKRKDTRSEPNDDPDKEPGGGEDDTVEKGGTVETPTVSVPIKKEDGSWDLSGVPDEARPFFAEMIEKADRTERDLKTARDELASSASTLRDRTAVEKAAELTHIGPSEELTEVLKAAAEHLEPEVFGKLEGILKSAEERVSKSKLFDEFGRSNGAGEESAGDAWAQIEKAADDLVEKGSGELSKAQAIARVLDTTEGARMYERYLAENGQGVS